MYLEEDTKDKLDPTVIKFEGFGWGKWMESKVRSSTETQRIRD